MRSPLARNLRLLGLLWLMLATVAPTARALENGVSGDFDGDGKRDRAVVDRHEPSVIRVWLSKTRRTDLVRARTAVAAIAATDLDGDRRAELIARGGARTGLQVWTREHSRFRAFGGKGGTPRALPAPVRHSIQQEGDSASPLLPSPRVVAPAVPSSSLTAAGEPTVDGIVPRHASAHYAGRHLTASSPRSPPFPTS